MGGSGRLVGLDLARVFAALAVVLFHLGYLSWTASGSTPGSVLGGAAAFPEIAPAAFWGRFGVEIFFVVSGFVIAFSAARSGPWRFLRSRVLRLVPAVLICATVTLLVARTIEWREDEWLLEAYLRSITFSLHAPWIDGAYWSLGVEIVFYGLVLCLLCLRRFAWLEATMVIAGLISTAFWIWKWAAEQGFLAAPALPLTPRDHTLWFLGYGATFAAGVVIWAGSMKGWTLWRVAALLCLALGTSTNIYLTAPAYMAGVDPVYQPLPVAIWLGAVVLLLLSIRFDGQLRSRLSDRALRIVQFLGLATYPLYLLHSVVGAAILRGLVGIGVERYAALGSSIAAMVAAAMLVTLAAEPLVRRGLAALLDWRPRLRRART